MMNYYYPNRIPLGAKSNDEYSELVDGLMGQLCPLCGGRFVSNARCFRFSLYDPRTYGLEHRYICESCAKKPENRPLAEIMKEAV